MSRANVQRVAPVLGSWPVTVRPSPVTTVPPTTIGLSVRWLVAVHSWRRLSGTTRAGTWLGAGPEAGLLTVARAELFHQKKAATTATTRAIAAAATRSPLVRRSGLTI